MACCAFALYLLSQLLLPFAALRERLGFAPHHQPSVAVAWSPGQPAAAPARRLRRYAGPLILAQLAGAGIATAAFAATPPEAADTAFEQALHTAICSIRNRP